MNQQFIFELFPSYLPKQSNPEHFIEVFDFYECEYGSIFYKGNHIYSFSKENYYEQVSSYFHVKKMKDLGLDIKQAKVLVYEMSIIEPSFQASLPNLNVSDSSPSNYQKFLKDFQADFQPLQLVIQSQEAKYKKMCPTAPLSFVQHHDL